MQMIGRRFMIRKLFAVIEAQETGFAYILEKFISSNREFRLEFLRENTMFDFWLLILLNKC